MYDYECYENSGGGLFLVILDRERNPVKIFEGWEFSPQSGLMRDSIAQLDADPDTWEDWDGDCLERINDDRRRCNLPPLTIDDLYAEIEGGDDMFAWCYSGFYGVDINKMGLAARDAMGIPDED